MMITDNITKLKQMTRLSSDVFVTQNIFISQYALTHDMHLALSLKAVGKIEFTEIY